MNTNRPHLRDIILARSDEVFFNLTSKITYIRHSLQYILGFSHRKINVIKSNHILGNSHGFFRDSCLIDFQAPELPPGLHRKFMQNRLNISPLNDKAFVFYLTHKTKGFFSKLAVCIDLLLRGSWSQKFIAMIKEYACSFLNSFAVGHCNINSRLLVSSLLTLRPANGRHRSAVGHYAGDYSHGTAKKAACDCSPEAEQISGLLWQIKCRQGCPDRSANQHSNHECQEPRSPTIRHHCEIFALPENVVDTHICNSERGAGK